MAIEGMVHPIHEMRRPARVGLDADDLKVRMALEDAAENERTDDVLVTTDNRHERVDLGTTRRLRNALIRSQDVEAERHL